MRLSPKRWATGFLIFFLPVISFADENPNGSYIEQLKKEIGPEKSSSENYSEIIKKNLEHKEPTSNSSYIEKLKATDPEVQKGPPNEDETYIDHEKAKLAPKELGGAIQAVKEGNSQLEAKKTGDIHHAFGMRYGVSLTRDVSAAPGILKASFSSIYGGNYAPDLSFFYEFQPFHSEWFGNLGIIGMGGLAYFNGYGQFAFPIAQPNGGYFSSLSNVKFQFFTIPVSLGLSYRFNLFRILRPYVVVAPTLIGYLEMRSDSIAGYHGDSRGLLTSLGVSILLDWMSSKSSWDLYTNYSVKHSYLTIDYSRLSTLGGDVHFTTNGIVMGLAIEY